MARKPNYGFERRERERLKAEKKATRAAAKKEAKKLKAEQAGQSKQPDTEIEGESSPSLDR